MPNPPPIRKPTLADRRKSSTLHYHTFPVKPPTSRGRPPPGSSSAPKRQTPSSANSASHASSSSSSHHHQKETPLPKKQLAVLAVIALAEQTALNSISPYLPEMASTFPEVSDGQVGLYVGLIASAFAFAQFATNFFWGWLSDRVGRKPIILIGTLATAGSFVAFGFCRTLWQAILVQVIMGLVNGNQGVVSTCLGEITDRSNQNKAFTYLPVVYGIGGITGPALGGLLVTYRNPVDKSEPNPYPYLLPNLFAAAVLLIDFVVTAIMLEESLEEAKDLPPLHRRVVSMFSWLWQFSGSSTRPTYTRKSSRPGSDNARQAPSLLRNLSSQVLKKKHIFNRDVILILITYLIFQLSNVAYNSLYPIFAEGAVPTGRDLSTEEVGISLAFAGLVTIVFQVGIYEKIMDKLGNKITYRASILLFVLAFLFMPWVGYKDLKGFGNGKEALYAELAVVLVIKTVASIGGLTSALLLVSHTGNHLDFLVPMNPLLIQDLL